MKIRSVSDPEFCEYGRVVEEFDGRELLARLKDTPCPAQGTVYVASDPALEQTRAFRWLRDTAFGGLPIEIGYCNGVNNRLNALEYHRSSEINLPADEMILLLGRRQDIDGNTFSYDTANVRAFRVPAGTAVEIYATTLHFAPCGVGGAGFRNAVVLPRGTNQPLPHAPEPAGEGKLLFAANKWLIAHPASDTAAEGAFVGLTGENIAPE